MDHNKFLQGGTSTGSSSPSPNPTSSSTISPDNPLPRNNQNSSTESNTPQLTSISPTPHGLTLNGGDSGSSSSNISPQYITSQVQRDHQSTQVLTLPSQPRGRVEPGFHHTTSSHYPANWSSDAGTNRPLKRENDQDLDDSPPPNKATCLEAKGTSSRSTQPRPKSRQLVVLSAQLSSKLMELTAYLLAKLPDSWKEEVLFPDSPREGTDATRDLQLSDIPEPNILFLGFPEDGEPPPDVDLTNCVYWSTYDDVINKRGVPCTVPSSYTSKLAYLDRFIDEEKGKVEAGGSNERLEDLREARARHVEDIRTVTERIEQREGAKDEEEFSSLTDRLFSLESIGPNLEKCAQQLQDTQESTHDKKSGQPKSN